MKFATLVTTLFITLFIFAAQSKAGDISAKITLLCDQKELKLSFLNFERAQQDEHVSVSWSTPTLSKSYSTPNSEVCNFYRQRFNEIFSQKEIVLKNFIVYCEKDRIVASIDGAQRIDVFPVLFNNPNARSMACRKIAEHFNQAAYEDFNP